MQDAVVRVDLKLWLLRIHAGSRRCHHSSWTPWIGWKIVLVGIDWIDFEGVVDELIAWCNIAHVCVMLWTQVFRALDIFQCVVGNNVVIDIVELDVERFLDQAVGLEAVGVDQGAY